MNWEKQVLLQIHELGSPALDGVFLVSHYMGTAIFCTVLVVAVLVVLLIARRKHEAAAWAIVGISTYLLQFGLKRAFGRVRPHLWDGPVFHSSFAFPSGHALASATLFPILAWFLSRRYPKATHAAWVAATILALFVGFGRLYLGVHWPTDVLAGWTLGCAQTALFVTYGKKRGWPDFGPGN